MTPSLRFDKWLPDCLQDAEQLQKEGKLTHLTCCNCQVNLTSPKAAYSVAGWKETQISGMCEPCFDDLFKEQEE